MSWDAYVDSIISKGGDHCSKAAIIGQDGAIWTPKTKDTVLDFTQAEASQIAQIMKSKTGAKEFPEKGIHVGKSKYMFVRDVYGDGRVILGKKKDLGGITLAATKTAIVAGFTPEGKQQGSTNIAVEDIAKYLEDSNF